MLFRQKCAGCLSLFHVLAAQTCTWLLLCHSMAVHVLQAPVEKEAGNGHLQQQDGQATMEPQNQAESNVELNLAVALRIISEKGCVIDQHLTARHSHAHTIRHRKFPGVSGIWLWPEALASTADGKKTLSTPCCSCNCAVVCFACSTCFIPK